MQRLQRPVREWLGIASKESEVACNSLPEAQPRKEERGEEKFVGWVLGAIALPIVALPIGN